jgi:hypothetical protein
MPSLIASDGMLVGISTPYRRMGLLHAKHRDHFGQPGDDVLVVQGDAGTFNPTLSAALIESHRASDPESAVAEWDAQFRTDIAQFLSEDLIELAIDRSRPAGTAAAAWHPVSGFCRCQRWPSRFVHDLHRP